MIEVDKLLKTFPESHFSLEISNFQVEQGEVVGIVGNNGAGKSTFLKTMLDLIIPDDGLVKIYGENVHVSDKWKKITGAFLDEFSLIDFLSAPEYIQFVAKINGINEKTMAQKIETINNFYSPEEFSGKKYISDYSTGNKHKIGIVGALLNDPKIVLLDEPFANLDPTSQINLKNIIRNINKAGSTTFILSSHNLDHVLDICSRVILFEKGKIIEDLPNSESLYNKLMHYFKKQTQTEIN